MTGICFCLRPGCFGFSPSKTAPIVWTCSTEHAGVVQRTYGKEHVMDEIAAKARLEAGKVAGGYLDKLGKSDIGALTKDEYDMLIMAIVETYRDEMTKLCEPF